MHKQIKKYILQGNKKGHKDLLIRSLITSLIISGKIKTTTAKAKVIKSQFDKLVTHAKKENTAAANQLRSFFDSNDQIIERLTKITKEKLGDRNSGYTRVIKTLPRKGDNAEQAYVMIINFEGRQVKSEAQKLLEKQEKEKKSKTVGAKVKKAVSNAKAKAQK